MRDPSGRDSGLASCGATGCAPDVQLVLSLRACGDVVDEAPETAADTEGAGGLPTGGGGFSTSSALARGRDAELPVPVPVSVRAPAGRDSASAACGAAGGAPDVVLSLRACWDAFEPSPRLL